MFLITCRDPEQGELTVLDCATREDADQLIKQLEGWSDIRLFSSAKQLDSRAIGFVRALFMSNHPDAVTDSFLNKVGIVPA